MRGALTSTSLPRPVAPKIPRPSQASGLSHPRVSDCPTGCADVAAPLIHYSCLGQGIKAASSPGNDCISKSPSIIPLKSGKGKEGESPPTHHPPPTLSLGSFPLNNSPSVSSAGRTFRRLGWLYCVSVWGYLDPRYTAWREKN